MQLAFFSSNAHVIFAHTTYQTTWDRPGLDNEQNAYLNESAQTNDTGSGESQSDDENEDDKSYSDAGSLPPDWIGKALFVTTTVLCVVYCTLSHYYFNLVYSTRRS
jgi:hypothetical protein